MSHHEPESSLSPIEQTFKDYMQHGDDFMKIEIFRNARTWYKKALELNIETERVTERLAECERLLRYERKVFAILGGIGAILLIICLSIN